MVQLLENGVLFRHLGASLFRVLCGFGIAVLIAFPTGIALALLPLFSTLVRSLLNFLRQIPPLAVVPHLILGFGIGEAPLRSVHLTMKRRAESNSPAFSLPMPPHTSTR